MANRQQAKAIPLRALRNARGLSLTDLSKISGIDKGSLSRIERGHRAPTVGTLAKIAGALDLPELSQLLSPWVGKS